MELQEGKEKFIESWGSLASQWGISRSMAQVHALLLVSTQPKSCDDIIEELKISRGSANTNLRKLMDWGLAHKRIVSGERREYFVAEKDMWEVFRRILVERKKKELEPMLRMLDELSAVEPQCEESTEFCNLVKEIKVLSGKADAALNRLARADAQWMMRNLISVL